MKANTLRGLLPPSERPYSPLSAAEMAQHEIAINRLCDEFPAHQRLVRELYHEILASFLEQANIRRFLSVLVSREVKLYLSKSGH